MLAVKWRTGARIGTHTNVIQIQPGPRFAVSRGLWGKEGEGSAVGYFDHEDSNVVFPPYCPVRTHRYRQ